VDAISSTLAIAGSVLSKPRPRLLTQRGGTFVWLLAAQLTVLVMACLVLDVEDADMDDTTQQFGENVRRARHERGWTQEDLSARTGLAVVQISRIERGKREIRLTTLIRLLDAFDVAPETLLNGLLS
jgi:DNA-binding Xre family transcriptional regulator